MEKVIISATKRSLTGKKIKTLRQEGILPAVIYGHHVKPTPISLNLKEASKVLANATTSSLIDIDLEGKAFSTLVRERQRDFIKGNLIHVDFQAVSLTEKIRAVLGIELVGVAPAVKELNGVVISGLSEIEIECLPQDLPERMVVDISELATIGSGIFLKDLKISDAVSVLTDPEEMVVIITSGTAEEVEEEVELEDGTEEPDVIEKGKKEEEGDED